MPIVAVLEVLEVLGYALFGAGAFANGLARLFETDVFKDWYFGQQSHVTDSPPLLGPDIQPLFMQYQHHMDMLYQFDFLLRGVS